MPSKKTQPDEPEIHTTDGERGDVRVELHFPTGYGANYDKAPTAHLTITDTPSRQVLVKLSLSAGQFTQMLGGSAIQTHASVLVPQPDRVGKRSQNTSTDIEGLRDSIDAEAEAVKERYLAEGWEVVRIDRTNFGRRVVAYRWID